MHSARLTGPMPPTGVPIITNEEVTAKANSQSSLGMISALIAGFSLTALVETEVQSSAAAGLFIVSASVTLGLSTLAMMEATLEYVFVMREFPHGTYCAWSLLEELAVPRRVAEACFVLALLCSLISTACMLQVRYGERATLRCGTRRPDPLPPHDIVAGFPKAVLAGGSWLHLARSST